jgi:MFS family permease
MTASTTKTAADKGESKTGLLGDRDFTAVLVGQGVSAMGSAVTMVAMPLLVLLLTGSGLLMGIVGILETATDLLIGLPAGAFADRWDRRKVMILTDAGAGPCSPP